MAQVMIVDDDRTMVSLLKMLLEMEGLTVAGAPAADRILDEIRAESPDVVLMDVFLPGVDGMEVLSELRASSDIFGARVIMTSGMDLGDQCMAAGADAFLLKPYTPEQLIRVVRDNLPGAA
jgi:two-component system response regulator MtrA